MSLRVVMMGTGGFALPTFLGLLESRHVALALFTQPDRTGKGHHRHENALKSLALERKIPVFQPENVNLPESIDRLRSLAADVALVAAYGQILSAELLGTPRRCAINVHASLLPKYRGAAPIQRAILNGETETGVTIFQIEPKLDAGPMFALGKTQIGPRETAGELESRLADLGAELALDVLDKIESGTAVGIQQDGVASTRAPRLKKEHGRIDWHKTVRQIDCQVRALQPWPLAESTLLMSLPGSGSLQRLRLIVLEVGDSTGVGAEAGCANHASARNYQPGTVVVADRRGLLVQAGDGPLEIVRLQPEGKRAMTGAEFLRGYKVWPGDRFESPLS